MDDRSGSSRQRPVEEFSTYLSEVVGEPVDEALLRRALTHRSWAYENGGVPHNERLEFLGDSVLGLVVTEALYRAHPDVSEGQLARYRASVVSTKALAEVGRTIGLGDHVLLGKGEESTGGRDKSSILADTVEAVIGATYLAQGPDAATRLVRHLVDPLLARSATLGAGLDWKTSLQELCVVHCLPSPRYEGEHEGPDHARVFTARAVIGDETRGTGTGRSKKVAEACAAEQAYEALRAELGTERACCPPEGQPAAVEIGTEPTRG
ncbi:ribonuclease III [Janibacter massiliensis]|uniref:ribonuclease III n=1 Tax=Janibacter massiliensis TaxID=2058291 RepID=UPI000D0F5297|nr:ribonuclease III [Janibacter massiliensis]